MKKARRTWHDGVYFRSRLEARWAARFDAAGLAWSYEPARFYLGNFSYLPDFLAPDAGCYAEVKPAWPDLVALFKARMLAEQSRCVVYLLVGNPATAEYGRFIPASLTGLRHSLFETVNSFPGL